MRTRSRRVSMRYTRHILRSGSCELVLRDFLFLRCLKFEFVVGYLPACTCSHHF